jgi:hypothetical protein
LSWQQPYWRTLAVLDPHQHPCSSRLMTAPVLQEKSLLLVAVLNRKENCASWLTEPWCACSHGGGLH